MILRLSHRILLALIAFVGASTYSFNSVAATLSLSDVPLYFSGSIPPLNLIVLGRDHKLFYEAYNDATDLDGDGTLDIHYNPSIDYYGYFDSYKCYTYSSSNSRFEPASTTSNKKCSSQWSGDFLNYVTMARIDAIRKVLYGGYRSTDSSTSTVLERAFIPQDAHGWGKEYKSVANDGYNISDYAPYSAPSSGNYILFGNTTLVSGSTPLLRVLSNTPYRVWEWASIERPVLGSRVQHGTTGTVVSPTDYVVRVKVCDSGMLENNCQIYSGGNYKPVGLLQQYGENGSMKFGLLTGSYGKNLSGGVLRKNIGSITDEITSSTGVFTSTVGIIKTLDKIKILGFDSSYVHNSNCGFFWDNTMTDGKCRAWGNPIGEMMYEALRYYAGKASGTSGFGYSSGGDDDTLGLPNPTWSNPYASSANPRCAAASIMIMSDVYPSYDSDSVPGSYFNSVTGDLSPALNASSLGQTMWNTEYGTSKSVFIGQSGTNYDGAPSAKTVTSFGDIRGLAPAEPGNQGSYYTASAAYYGHINDISAATGTQNITTFSIALASHLPEINITVSGKTIKLIPFGKSVGGCASIDKTQGQFQPTNTIVDFYVESLSSTAGTFRLNFEDAQQGADHDMDAIVRYDYVVNADNTVTITLTSSYAAGCIIQHMGYVISGTTADGTYLEVRDADTSTGSDVDYFLDTPPGQTPGGTWNDSTYLPLTTSRTFTPSSTGSSTILLENPLWYAAKWGGFDDSNNNNVPDVQDEWDPNQDGVPDNYFLVTNPLTLSAKLVAALDRVLELTTSSSSDAVNNGFLSSESRVYQVRYNTARWSGQVLSFPVNSDGSINNTGGAEDGAEWESSTLIGAPSTRKIITYKPSTKKGIPFQWPSNPSSPSATELDTSQSTYLNTSPDTGVVDSKGSQRVDYLRGDRTKEQMFGGYFRNRDSRLGDIIYSTPVYVGKPNFHYKDTWPSGASETSSPYSTFVSTYKNRTPALYVGSNDGMLHGFNADTGAELFGYIPSTAYSRLNKLTATKYSHQYFVDGSPSVGDVYYGGAWHTVVVGGLNKGGQGIYALEVTNPSNFLESNAGSMVLWEYKDTDDAGLGYTYSQPIIARLANGSWAAIFGNGYNNTEADGNASTTGNAVLYIVDISTGTLIQKIDTKKGMSGDPTGANRANGLASPVGVDVDSNGIIEAVYAGDLFGNLWKFDLSSSNAAQWDSAFKTGSTPKPLFTAVDSSGTAQAITSRPSVGKMANSTNGVVIYFGTGKYLESSDKSTTGVQTFYAIYDDQSSTVSGRSVLLKQEILAEVSVSNGDGTSSDYRVTTENEMTSGKQGWYLDLIVSGGSAAGERQVSHSILRGNRIIFTTLIPDSDVCNFGGTSWLMELDADSGSRLTDNPPLDVDNDDDFDSSDSVSYSYGGTTSTAVVSGMKSTEGIISTPAIIPASDSKEYKYTPGTSGNIQVTPESTGDKTGRQSWRQIQ